MVTRTHFHRSRFISLLSELVAIDGGGALDAFAEKLGQWIHIADAIGLRAAHHAPSPAAATAVPHAQLEALQAAFVHTRSAVDDVLDVALSASAGSRKTHIPLPQSNTPLEVASAYEPFRRYYVAQQREMELKARPLRARLRDAAAKGPPPLRQLAGLDTALDAILAEREALLLAKVPSLMERRFKQLRQSHLDALAVSGVSDSIDIWLQPGGWMARFREEMQAVLRAEWDMRLQPAMGLLEALHNEKIKSI